MLWISGQKERFYSTREDSYLEATEGPSVHSAPDLCLDHVVALCSEQ